MKALKIVLLLVVSLTILAFTSIINPEKTISEKVAEKENLSTLFTALEAADLVDVLKEEGPYTVFAPTNEAFENLPEGKLDDLLKAENKEELTKILKNHVISGKVYARDIESEKMIQTLEGTELKVKAQRSVDEYTTDEEYMGEKEAEGMNRITVNNVTVSESDISVSNGVIHIIDEVVMPEDREVIGAN